MLAEFIIVELSPKRKTLFRFFRLFFFLRKAAMSGRSQVILRRK